MTAHGANVNRLSGLPALQRSALERVRTDGGARPRLSPRPTHLGTSQAYHQISSKHQLPHRRTRTWPWQPGAADGSRLWHCGDQDSQSAAAAPQHAAKGVHAIPGIRAVKCEVNAMHFMTEQEVVHRACAMHCSCKITHGRWRFLRCATLCEVAMPGQWHRWCSHLHQALRDAGQRD